MRCLDEATAAALGGRGDDPDLGRLDVLLPRQRLHGGARLRARVRVVRPDRRVRRALRQPLHARLLPRRVRRGPPLARPLDRGRGDARGLDRGLLPVAAGHARRPARALAELRRRQARAAEASRLLDRRGLVGGGAAVPGAAGARRRRRAPAVELVERLLRQAPAERRLERVRRSSSSSARASRGASSTRRARRSTALRELARLVGTEPLRAATELAEGMLAAARGEHERARTLLEDAVDRFQRERRAVRGGAGADRARRRPSPPLGRADRRRARGGGAALHALGRARGGAPTVPAAATTRGDATPREREVLAPPRRGAHEPPDRRAAGRLRAHGASPRHQHPPQARPPLAGRRPQRTPRAVAPC